MAQAAAGNKKKKIFDGRYEILSIVGRGSGSVVYRARHVTAPHNEVALKVLVNKKGGAPSSDQLRKEALAMVSSRHKYTVRLDDFHSVQQLCYLSMEFAPEGDLRKYIGRKGTLPIIQIERFMLQVAEALAFIHQAGILHRDIKPENILIVNDRQCRLADFGVAVLPGEESSIEDLQRGVGTMDYMAPEVLEAIECTKQSDVYLFGATFYEIITGVQPFANVPLAQVIEVRKKLKPIQSLRRDCPDSIAKIIEKALAFNTADRYESARDLYEQLLAAKSHDERSAAPPAPRALARPQPLAAQVETSVQSAQEPATSPPAKAKITPAALLQAAGVEESVGKPAASNSKSPSQKKNTSLESMTADNAASSSRPKVTAESLLVDQEAEDEKDPKKAATARARRKRRRNRRRARLSAEAKQQETLDGTPAKGVSTNEQKEANAEVGNDFTLTKENQRQQRLRPPLKNTDSRNTVATPASESTKSQAIMKPALDSEDKLEEKTPSPFENKPEKNTAQANAAQKKSAAMGALFGGIEQEPKQQTPNKIISKQPATDAGPVEVAPTTTRTDQADEKNQEDKIFKPIEANTPAEETPVAKEEEPIDDGYHADDFYNSSTETITGSQTMINPNMDSRQKSWFLRVMVIVIMIFVADDLSRRWTDKGLAERAIEMTGFSGESSLLPFVSASTLPFPNLPEGQYSGIITGLIKDTPIPLSITRPTGSNKLYVTVGLHGWVPAEVPVTANATTVRLRSSGLILTFSGVDTGDRIQGTFINDITAEEGTWEVAPVRKR